MASDRQRVLVVGGGSIGERHARCFLRTERCEVAVCDTDAALLQRLAGDYPLAGTYPNLEAALEETWDAAVVATPAHLHVEQALALVRREVHVLIEKPLSTRLDGVGELRAEVKRQGRTAGVAYVLRAHPAVIEMKSRLAPERILHVVGCSGQHFPTYRPAYRETYYRDRTTGGGAVQDALTHLANLVQHLVGPFDWVFADYEHQALEGVEVEDTVNVLGRLRDGAVLGSLSLNQFQSPNETTVDLHMPVGSFRLELHRHRWGFCLRPGVDWAFKRPQPLDRDDLFILQAHSFLDAIAGRGRPTCDLYEGEQSLRFNLAALQSRVEGRPVRLDEVGAEPSP